MIGVIATIRTVEGGGPGFETVFRELAAQVRAHEPGNIVYDLFRSRSEADTYRVLEIYRDAASLAMHRYYPHFREIVPRMAEFRIGKPEVEYLDGID